MKTFIKRFALTAALLFTALICMGIVYIDNTKHYFYQAGGIVQMFVHTNYVFGVDTNTGRVGFGITNTTSSFSVVGKQPATNATGNGASASASGRVGMTGGKGGGTFAPTTAVGGIGGQILSAGGDGGDVPLATTNATGGAGGTINYSGGIGGMNGVIGVATNATTGGAGGGLSFNGGAGGAPASESTNTVGGAGGVLNFNGGQGSTPTAGWARKAGNGGTVNINGGAPGANAVRTNGANGGAINITGGVGGGVATTPGDGGVPGNINLTAGAMSAVSGGGNGNPGGLINITAGAGGTGATNSDGGHVFISGGAPGAGAVPGNVVLARTSAGASLGAGVQVGPFIAGGTATITNVLGGAAALDFPSTAAGAFSELTIAVTGATSNNLAVALSVPWESAQLGGAFVTFNSNDVVYVRFINNSLVAAIDPTPGTFAVVGFRIR